MHNIRNIKRLHNIIENSLFTINGNLCYDRVTDAILKLAQLKIAIDAAKSYFRVVSR